MPYSLKSYSLTLHLPTLSHLYIYYYTTIARHHQVSSCILWLYIQYPIEMSNYCQVFLYSIILPIFLLVWPLQSESYATTAKHYQNHICSMPICMLYIHNYIVVVKYLPYSSAIISIPSLHRPTTIITIVHSLDYHYPPICGILYDARSLSSSVQHSKYIICIQILAPEGLWAWFCIISLLMLSLCNFYLDPHITSHCAFYSHHHYTILFSFMSHIFVKFSYNFWSLY